MPRGHNRLSLTLTSILQVALNKRSGKTNQGTMTCALRLLTEALKPEIDEIDPSGSAYEEHIDKFSKTISEQLMEKAERERLKIEDQKKRLAQKERELEVKESYLKLHQDQFDNRNENPFGTDYKCPKCHRELKIGSLHTIEREGETNCAGCRYRLTKDNIVKIERIE